MTLCNFHLARFTVNISIIKRRTNRPPVANNGNRSDTLKASIYTLLKFNTADLKTLHVIIENVLSPDRSFLSLPQDQADEKAVTKRTNWFLLRPPGPRATQLTIESVYRSKKNGEYIRERGRSRIEM